MAEPFTSYVLKNDQAFREKLAAVQAASNDLRVPFGLILHDFYRSERAIFNLKGPGQYPPFKNSVGVTSLGGKQNQYGRKRSFSTLDESPYQRFKLKKYGFDYPLLKASGKLAASLLSPNADGSISKITPLSLVFGTSVAYAIYHQSDEPRKKIPLRKMLFIGPEAPQFATDDQMGRLQRWVGYLNDHLEKAVKA